MPIIIFEYMDYNLAKFQLVLRLLRHFNQLVNFRGRLALQQAVRKKLFEGRSYESMSLKFVVFI